MEAVICDGEGNELGSVTFTQSEDIYEVYQTENAKQARFSIDISEISNADSLAMEVYLNGEYYTEIDLSKESYGDDGKLIFTIDVGSTAIMTADVLPEDGEDAITIGNGIVKIYQCFAWIVFGVAVIGYIYMFNVCPRVKERNIHCMEIKMADSDSVFIECIGDCFLRLL